MCPARRSAALRAFTLLELLIVIAVIIALAGLLFPVIGAVQEKGRKTQARSDLQQLVNAVNAYQTEYGKLPVPDTYYGSYTGDFMFGSGGQGGTNGDLMYVLRAQPRGNWNTPQPGTTQPLNPKQVAFLEVQPARNAANPVSGIDANGNWVDPWGGNYVVGMDGNYSGLTDVFSFDYTDIRRETNSTSGEMGIQTAVIGASKGKDKVIGKAGTGGAKTFQGSDDVITWQ